MQRLGRSYYSTGILYEHDMHGSVMNSHAAAAHHVSLAAYDILPSLQQPDRHSKHGQHTRYITAGRPALRALEPAQPDDYGAKAGAAAR